MKHTSSTSTSIKLDRVEFRVDPNDKAEMQRYAAKAGYSEREFSTWMRRVLLGDEPHPKRRRTRA